MKYPPSAKYRRCFLTELIKKVPLAFQLIFHSFFYFFSLKIHHVITNHSIQCKYNVLKWGLECNCFLFHDNVMPRAALFSSPQHESTAAEPLDELYDALADVLKEGESTHCYKNYLLVNTDTALF